MRFRGLASGRGPSRSTPPDAPADTGERASTLVLGRIVVVPATPRFTIADTTPNIMIDTRADYSDHSAASCGAATPGADAFLAFDGTAGERWHLHLSASSPDRRPMLFVASAAECGSASCAAVSSACEASGDEHVGLVLPSDGRWYVGVDDAALGGGLYTLSATRSICGDGGEAHGEGCDDGNLFGGDGCDASCRVELSVVRANELEPNDDRMSANAVVLPASGELEVTGSIGGACAYPDAFAIRVPAGHDLAVDALADDGTACASGALTPFELTLEDATGGVLATGMRAPNGCAIVRATSLPAGERFVRVEPRARRP